jgi:ABC-type branched-subunit amino acid transport system substrate-binding protein
MKLLRAVFQHGPLLAQVRRLWSGRALAAAGAAALLSGCAVVPEVSEPVLTPRAPDPVSVTLPAVIPGSTASALPSDETRHRVALLVPITGATANVGQSLANATTMALIDANASNLRITTYDTGKGAATAAQQAITDGNQLILGPLLAEDIPAVRTLGSRAGIPVISFSNDANGASPDALVMGHIPEQSINRSIEYARRNGFGKFAALFPEGEYGERSYNALTAAIRDHGGRLVAFERFARSPSAITNAAQRLRTRGGYDTVLIADTAGLAGSAAGELKRGSNSLKLMGTELWSGEADLARQTTFNGALFASVSDARFQRFSQSYETRFGSKPYRIATLGYDAVLLTLRVAQNWTVGDRFPKERLFDTGGFLGVDGPFRFARNGVVERALEVREVQGNRVVTVDAAPTGFGN